MRTHTHTSGSMSENNVARNGFWEGWLCFYAIGQTRNPNNETSAGQYITLRIYESYCQALFCITKCGILMITWRKRHILANSYWFYQVRRHFASRSQAYFSPPLPLSFFPYLFFPLYYSHTELYYESSTAVQRFQTRPTWARKWANSFCARVCSFMQLNMFSLSFLDHKIIET